MAGSQMNPERGAQRLWGAEESRLKPVGAQKGVSTSGGGGEEGDRGRGEPSEKSGQRRRGGRKGDLSAGTRGWRRGGEQRRAETPALSPASSPSRFLRWKYSRKETWRRRRRILKIQETTSFLGTLGLGFLPTGW